jgi:hypothetical protein
MLNLFLLTAGTWAAISFLFVWRLASAIPLGSEHAADTLPVDREARLSPRAPSPVKIGCEREQARHLGARRQSSLSPVPRGTHPSSFSLRP